MGFLDKAKQQLQVAEQRFQEATRGVGEETIRKSERFDEPPSKKKKKKKKEPRQHEKPEKKVKEKIRLPKPEKKPEKKVEEIPEPVPEPVPEPEEKSAFTVDDNFGKKFFEDKDREQKEFLDSYGDKPVPKVIEGRIQDVLELLGIPSTFEIDDSVLLPEDLEKIQFDLQVPQGYEMGQVDAFVNRVRHTVTVLVDLLKERNKHIAELATTVDRSQVDANNLKVQAEIANGINVMPTDSSDNLENENMELRLYIKRLEDQINVMENRGQSFSDEDFDDNTRQEIDRLKDKLSLLDKENQQLRNDNYELKNQLAEYIENDDSMPEAEASEDDSIPDISDDDFPTFTRTGIPDASPSSAFANVDEPLEDFLKTNADNYQGHDYESDGDDEVYQDFENDGQFNNNTAFSDPDEDDELDRLFNEDNDKDNR